MGDTVGRLDNSVVWGQAVEATPGQSYKTAAEAEAAARTLAAGNCDAVIRTEGDGYRVDTIDEIGDQARSRVRSNQLYGADPNVAAFVTGTGNTVSLRGTRDGSTDVDRVANVFQRVGLPVDDARSMAIGGVSQAQAQDAYERILQNDGGSLRD